MSTEGRLLWKL